MQGNAQYYIVDIVDMAREVETYLPALYLVRWWGQNLDTAEWRGSKDMFAVSLVQEALQAKREVIEGKRRNAVTNVGATQSAAYSRNMLTEARPWRTF